MTKKNKPADEPVERKKANVWAAEKAIPGWQMAAARMAARLRDGVEDFDGADLTEDDFDAAMDRVR
jgi:hypothetical protein